MSWAAAILLDWLGRLIDQESRLENWALKTFRPREWCRRENDHRHRVWQADSRAAELLGQPPPRPPDRVIPRMDGGL